MKHVHYMDQEPEKLETDGAKDAVIRHILTEKDGAPHFNFRVVTISEGGQTPDHTHPWEHEFFILSGNGICVVDNMESAASKGDVILVPPNTQHTIRAATEMEVI